MLPSNKSVAVFMALLGLAAIMSGCGGRSAHPVAVRQYGDENRSCSSLDAELRSIEGQISQLLPQTDKTKKNLGFGLLGLLVPVSWFFLDLSDAEQIEVDALRRRYNHLVALSSDRHCGQARAQIPDFRDQAAFQQQYQMQLQQMQQQQMQQQMQQMQQQQMQQQLQQQIRQLELNQNQNKSQSSQ